MLWHLKPYCGVLAVLDGFYSDSVLVMASIATPHMHSMPYASCFKLYWFDAISPHLMIWHIVRDVVRAVVLALIYARAGSLPALLPARLRAKPYVGLFNVKIIDTHGGRCRVPNALHARPQVTHPGTAVFLGTPPQRICIAKLGRLQRIPSYACFPRATHSRV